MEPIVRALGEAPTGDPRRDIAQSAWAALARSPDDPGAAPEAVGLTLQHAAMGPGDPMMAVMESHRRAADTVRAELPYDRVAAYAPA